MKSSVSKRLHDAKRRIERRLGRPRGDQGKPMFWTSILRIELADKVRAVGVGAEATVEGAIENTAKGSRIVAVGNFPEKPRVNVASIQDRELSLMGTLMYKHEDYQGMCVSRRLLHFCFT